MVYLFEMGTKQKQRTRTYARNRATSVSRRGYEKVFETDSTYFLKLVLVLLLGTLYIRFDEPIRVEGILFTAIPVGLILGLILIRQFEKHQSDRKIWYAILVITAILCFAFDVGVVI